MELCKICKLLAVSINNLVFTAIPSPGKMGPTVIDKSQPIEPIGSRSLDSIDSICWLLSITVGPITRERDSSINTEACQCTTCAR